MVKMKGKGLVGEGINIFRMPKEKAPNPFKEREVKNASKGRSSERTEYKDSGELIWQQ